MDNLFYIMNTVRDSILESFIIPGLGISYWKFIIYMAFAAIVIVALVNKLPISFAGQSMAESADRARQAKSREKGKKGR